MQAAQVLGQHTGAMQLRYMQSLPQLASDKTTTAVFPMPVDVFGVIADATSRADRHW